MKYIWITWLIFSAYVLIPPNWSGARFDLSEPNTLEIQGQACGCPCPEAYIKQGKILIPEKIRQVHPNIHLHQINLVGNSPYQGDGILMYEDVLIKGKVVDVDTILCDPGHCEVAPRFEVEQWKFDGYSYVWANLTQVHPLLFFIYFPLSLVLLLAGIAILVGKFFMQNK